MSGAGPEGRLCVFRFKGADFSGFAIVRILQKGEVSLNIGNIDVLAVGWQEYAMCLPLPLVDCGDGLPGYAPVVKGVDIKPPVPVADPEQVSVFLIEAEVTGPVVEVHLVVLLVGTVLVQVYDGTRYLAGVSTRGGDVEQGLAWVGGDNATRKVELHFLGNLKV